MFRRGFFTMLGLGAGIVIGVYATRRVRAARQAMRPSNVAARAADRAGGLRERLADAVAAGREAAEQKEAELRTVYRVEEPTQQTP